MRPKSDLSRNIAASGGLVDENANELFVAPDCGIFDTRPEMQDGGE